MDLTTLAFFLPTLFGTLFVLFILLFVVLSGRRKPDQSGAQRGREQGERPTGRWNGEILGNGALTAWGERSAPRATSSKSRRAR
ncbi:MAG: hypothetical protein JWN68_1723 [Nocardioides sp.]|jgi:hypothetical protein|uniref:hypothetical protein n=1 Tax=Nocardioides sp. TaxID=35761 RepID=UPI002637CA0F|nr:hypothetical protein [Nocardioides sp.]MCW2833770.1 hypothetical protein [Nocardioides sp.]